LAARYTSPSQQARVASEGWATRELYCPDCQSASLEATPVNSKAVDYHCPTCETTFQLKSSKKAIGNRIPDGAYAAMLDAIRQDRTPDLFLLQYCNVDWKVHNLVVVPRFAFSEQAIVPRPPLARTAKRAGWRGCVIDLAQVAPDARIPIVRNGEVIPASVVAVKYARLKPLAQIKMPTEAGPLHFSTPFSLPDWWSSQRKRRTDSNPRSPCCFHPIAMCVIRFASNSKY
jgi:type II restriction enzyme